MRRANRALQPVRAPRRAAGGPACQTEWCTAVASRSAPPTESAVRRRPRGLAPVTSATRRVERHSAGRLCPRAMRVVSLAPIRRSAPRRMPPRQLAPEDRRAALSASARVAPAMVQAPPGGWGEVPGDGRGSLQAESADRSIRHPPLLSRVGRGCHLQGNPRAPCWSYLAASALPKLRPEGGCRAGREGRSATRVRRPSLTRSHRPSTGGAPRWLTTRSSSSW